MRIPLGDGAEEGGGERQYIHNVDVSLGTFQHFDKVVSAAAFISDQLCSQTIRTANEDNTDKF